MNNKSYLMDKIQRTTLKRDAVKTELDNINLVLSELIEQLPRIYYVEGRGYHGLSETILFWGSKEECVEYVENELNMKINGIDMKKPQIVPILSDAGDYVAGLLKHWTPLDPEYFKESEIEIAPTDKD